MNARFTGRSVLVTGAASGIGLAAARAFVAEGALLTLADIDRDGVIEVAAALRAAGGEAIAVACDVADAADCVALVDAALRQWGRLDVAFNNAGIGSPMCDEFEDFSPADYARLMGVNVGGVFNCIHAEVPALKAAGGGAIVNTASVASFVAAPGMAAYVASKHAVAGLTKAAALDLVRHNIRVNAVCPGLTRTAILAPLDDAPEQLAAMAAQVPIGRMAEPEEIARAVLFLASAEASYCVGTLLAVDGGVLLP